MKMIKIETENISRFKKILLKNTKYGHSNRIQPGGVSDSIVLDYYQIKNELRDKISSLLNIRKDFTKKLLKDALLTLTTQNDEVEEDDIEYEKYRIDRSRFKRPFIDLSRAYVPKIIMIVLFSLFAFLIFSILVPFTKYYELIGWPLVCSKGSSLAIMVTTAVLMFFMSHDLMTYCRRKFRHR